MSNIKINEINTSDWNDIQELRPRVGLAGRLGDYQEQLFESNPLLTSGIKYSKGWVIKDNNKVVGFIGSIPLLYRFQNSDIISATANSFGVEPEYRNLSLQLASTFLNQKNIDLLLNTTADKSAEIIFSYFKSKKIPQKNYNKVLFYICNGRSFVKSVLIKKKIPLIIASLFSFILTPFLWLIQNRFFSLSTKENLEIKKVALKSIGEDFDKLWIRKTESEPNRLYAYRNSKYLKWHFGFCEESKLTILCAYKKNILLGYIIVMHEEVKEIKLKRSKIVDLFVEKDDCNIIDKLISEAYKHVKINNSSVLEMVGFPKNIRDRFMVNKPYSRFFQNWPFLYKSVNKKLKRDLILEESWYASPFDGDASF
tara:strand:- start:1080 stop:2183 length:1104 start_codon:yes stop_codon:yes gene_type:complete